MPSAHALTASRGPSAWLGVLLCALVWFQGCASYSDKTAQIRGLYQSQDYGAALTELDDSPLKDENKNRLLYQLERAQILDRKGDLKASRAALLEADRIADNLYTVSVSHQVASFLVNDGATEYGGEDFEIVAIHIQLALSFIEDNELKGALVEARKINSKLAEINQRYKDNKNRYAEDAFARYLAGMIYEASGNTDSAIIDYRQAIQTYDKLYRPQFGVSAPRSLIRAYYRALVRRGRSQQARQFLKSRGLKAAELDLPPPSYGRVVVIHEVGTINRKVNSEDMLPWDGKPIRFSFPHISPAPYQSPVRLKTRNSVEVGSKGTKVKSGVAVEVGSSAKRRKAAGKEREARKRAREAVRRSLAAGYGVGRRSGGSFHHAETVQDMNVIAHRTLEDRRGRIFAKTAARLVLKDQLAQKADKEFGPVAGLVVGIAGMVTETGDTRSWALLPAAYRISELYLPPGRHQVVVTHGVQGKKLRSIEVKAGRPVFIRAK